MRIAILLSFVFMFVGATRASGTDAKLTNGSAISSRAIEPTGPTPAVSDQDEPGLSQKAVEIARPFGFPITNSMIVTWIVAVGLIVFAQFATRRMKAVPEGAQNFWEWLVEGLHAFLEGIRGSHLVQLTFWFFATALFLVPSANWLGLIPGVGTIGWGHQGAYGFEIDQPLFRGANADVNLTLAMALVFFACWILWAIQEDGAVGFLGGWVCAQGRDRGADESSHGGGVLRLGLPGNCLHSVPAGLA